MPKEARKVRSSTATASERAAIGQLVRAARERGEDITGPDGLLKSITATVLEAALEEEMTDHLGHAKHKAPEGGAANIRNGPGPRRCSRTLLVRCGSRCPGTGGSDSLSWPHRDGPGWPHLVGVSGGVTV